MLECGFYLTCIFSYKDSIVDSDPIRENTSPRKLIFYVVKVNVTSTKAIETSLFPQFLCEVFLFTSMPDY